jgi:hypothetical protein
MALTQVQGGMILASGQSIPKAALPTGSVLQVVNSTYTNASAQSTTSSTYVQTPIQVTITPTSSTSKILVRMNVSQSYASTNSGNMVLTLYRNNTTELSSGNQYGLSAAYAQVAAFGMYIEFLDSPATTSATTYTVYAKFVDASGTFYYFRDHCWATMTAMEIAA